MPHRSVHAHAVMHPNIYDIWMHACLRLIDLLPFFKIAGIEIPHAAFCLGSMSWYHESKTCRHEYIIYHDRYYNMHACISNLSYAFGGHRRFQGGHTAHPLKRHLPRPGGIFPPHVGIVHACMENKNQTCIVHMKRPISCMHACLCKQAWVPKSSSCKTNFSSSHRRTACSTANRDVRRKRL